MNIILQQDVARVGTRGQTLRVKDGYARNFLFPRGLAVPATAAAAKRAAVEQQALHTRLNKARAYIEQHKAQLEQKSVTIAVAVGPDEQMFGTVTNAHIAAALAQEGVIVEKRKIELAEPIAALGVYHVPVHLHPQVTATINVWVVKQ